MEIKTTTTYVAFDGTEFSTEVECQAYENTNRIRQLKTMPADIPFDWYGVGGKFYLCKNESERQILLDYIHDTYYDSAYLVDKDDIAIGWNLIVDDMNDETVCHIYTMKQYIAEMNAALESVKELM